MFRMPPQMDPEEESKRAREAVKSNVLTFILLCAVIRIAPMVIDKIGMD